MSEKLQGPTIPPVLPTIATPRVLAGQKALVTGANSGIGQAVAIALGRAGADVMVNYVAGDAAAEAVAQRDPRLRREGDRAQGRRVEGGRRHRDVRSCARRARHGRHPDQQRRVAARRAVRSDDARSVEPRDWREPDRAVPLRARGRQGVQAARPRPGGLGRRRQDHLHQLGPRGHPVGGPRELRGVERRRDADDEEHRAGSRAPADSREQHLSWRRANADQHRRVEHARGVRARS